MNHSSLKKLVRDMVIYLRYLESSMVLSTMSVVSYPEDVVRLGKYVLTPKGILWGVKQGITTETKHTSKYTKI